MIGGHQTLRSLALGKRYNFHQFCDLTALINTVSQKPGFKTLNIRVEDPVAVWIDPSCTPSLSVTELVLRASNLSQIPLAPLLATLPNVTTLHVSGGGFDAEPFLAVLLSLSSQLVSLSIVLDAPIAADSDTTLFHSIIRIAMPMLESLTLSGPTLSSDAVKHIVAEAQLPSLARLSVGGWTSLADIRQLVTSSRWMLLKEVSVRTQDVSGSNGECAQLRAEWAALERLCALRGTSLDY